MRHQTTLSSPLLLAAAAMFVLVLLLWSTGVRFNLTPSLPPGLYRYVDAEPEKGLLVTFCPPPEVAPVALERGYLHRGACEGGTQPLGKLILAMPGDTVAVSPEGLVVDGAVVPNSAVHWRDALGRALLHVPFGTHVVGPDSLFLFSSHHPRSFDSRYFGAVPKTRIISVARPLWTF